MNACTAEFLRKYETAIAGPDSSAISALYADVFLFGAPQGTQPITKDDFLQIVPKRKRWFASIGSVESKGALIEERSLDSKYLLVKTKWTMTFEKTGRPKRNIDTFATYILEWHGEAAKIVFQIDHQELTAKVNELELACPPPA